jgi:hypothetical protein
MLLQRSPFILRKPDDPPAGGGSAGAGTGTGSGAGTPPATPPSTPPVGQGDPGSGGETPPASVGEWLAKQPEAIQALYKEDVKGLKSALESERETKKSLESQLRDAAAKLEKGSEAQQALTKLADEQAQSQKRVDFYEAAQDAGVKNLRLAWAAASADEEVWDRKGNCDFEKLKARYPELFAAKPPPPAGNAGSGAGQPGAGKPNMNDFIRQSTGRR